MYKYEKIVVSVILRGIIRDNEELFIMIKDSIHQEI